MNEQFPNASDSFRRLNAHIFGAVPAAGADRLRADEPQPGQGRALDRDAPRETGGACTPAQRTGPGRFRVLFTVYAVRPLDYDNVRIKPLQDCLVAAGFLPDDNWKVLEGEVRSCKAKSKAEERTVIEIWRLET